MSIDKKRLDSTPEGELVLFVYDFEEARKERGENPRPTFGVFCGRCNPPHQETYVFNSLMWLVGGHIITPEGKKFPLGRGAGYHLRPDENLVDLRVGKDEILAYLSNRPDLIAHTENISKLQKPYNSNFVNHQFTFMSNPSDFR